MTKQMIWVNNIVTAPFNTSCPKSNWNKNEKLKIFDIGLLKFQANITLTTSETSSINLYKKPLRYP